MYQEMNTDLSQLETWFMCNKLSLNVSKTNYMLFHDRDKSPADAYLYINKTKIHRVKHTKFLGMTIDEQLTWSEHISNVCKKASHVVYNLNRVKHILNKQHKLTLYNTLLYPHLNYGVLLWGSAAHSHKRRLKVLQKKAVRAICNVAYNEHTSELFQSLKILKIEDIYKLSLGRFMYQYNNDNLPIALMTLFIPSQCVHFDYTRGAMSFYIKRRRTKKVTSGFLHQGPLLWQQLSSTVKWSNSVKQFCKRYKHTFFVP